MITLILAIAFILAPVAYLAIAEIVADRHHGPVEIATVNVKRVTN
jgi:hypothetical protein